MLSKPDTCKGCALERLGRGFSAPSGNLTHGVALVGEALGDEEASAGVPFVGRAGQLLNRLIARTPDPSTGLRLKREDFRVYNTIWCQPPDNQLTGAPWEDASIAHCRPNLDLWIARDRPRVILALGNQALQRLTGHWGIDDLRGYYFPQDDGTIVIGTYHPSYIMRGNFEVARVFQLDLIKALNCAKKGPATKERSYILHPQQKDFASFYEELLAAPEKPVAFDIETPYGDAGDDKDDEFLAIEDNANYTILRISFSHKEGWAMTMPWMEPYKTWAKRILALPNPKVSWNGESFDVPRLAANGAPLGGDHFDAMLMWHCLEPSLPMGLKYVGTIFCPDMPAWKLQSASRPEWYNAADSDVTICCFNEIYRGLEAQGRIDMYRKHFVRVGQVLRSMSSRGIAVDREVRTRNRERFSQRFAETVSKLQSVVPTEIRPRKIYTYDEDRLKKQDMWTEGRMIVVKGMGSPKATEEIVDGWIVKKPKPPKKERKKREDATADAKDKPKRRRKKKVAGSGDQQLEQGTEQLELPGHSGDPSDRPTRELEGSGARG